MVVDTLSPNSTRENRLQPGPKTLRRLFLLSQDKVSPSLARTRGVGWQASPATPQAPQEGRPVPALVREPVPLSFSLSLPRPVRPVPALVREPVPCCAGVPRSASPTTGRQASEGMRAMIVATALVGGLLKNKKHLDLKNHKNKKQKTENRKHLENHRL